MTRVLVVEDEDSFSDAISYLLRKEGFEVAVCSTGPDALETFDRTGADLVLLDLMLPGLPGRPGSIRSSSTRSAPVRSNVSSASGPVEQTATSNPSLRSR